MPKVVVTNWVEEDALQPLHRLGATVAANRGREPWPNRDLRARLADADVMVAFMPDRVDADLLQAAPRLNLIACALKGHDNIDLAACRARNVAVTIVEDLLTAPGAELAIGSMIALGRHVLEADAFVRSGRHQGWRPQFYGLGLAGSTVGFLGFGAIGRAVAKRLRAFECARLLAYDLQQPPPEAGVSAATDEQVLSESDFIVLAMSLNDGSRQFVNRDRLSLVKPGALLINLARGSLVDEAAVADALEAGRLGGYAADVFAFEDWAVLDRPRAIEQRLLALRDRTLLTPHLGSAVAIVRRRIAEAAIGSVVAFLSGKPLQGRIA
jgi:phosphonate dehydrogenase